MVALRLSWNNPESLELQKSYNVVSPRRGFMVATIFFQCILGTACTSSRAFGPKLSCVQYFVVDLLASSPSALRIWGNQAP